MVKSEIGQYRNSFHSLYRAKERAGLNRRRAENLINLARKRGMGAEACRWSLDRSYLSKRTDEAVVAIAYNGYCFIFDRKNYACITLYELPKWFGKKKVFYYADKTEKIVFEEDYAC